MKGVIDIDKNGYLDLIVGVFGVDWVILYRVRLVIIVNVGFEVYFSILN